MRRSLTAALSAAALVLSSAALVAAPASAAPGAIAGRGATPDATMSSRDVRQVRPPKPLLVSSERGDLASSARARAGRPLFAFWGQKYNLIDGFSFLTVTRGSGASIQMEASWKTYRGVRPILPKVAVQARVDGGRWATMKGIKGTITKRFVQVRLPAHTVPAGVVAQTVDYRFKTKKLKKGPRRARRSVASKPVSARYENQAMYTGDQARFYAPIASLCPTASITLDTMNITEEHDGGFDRQYGIVIDAAALAASPAEPEVSKLGISIHECAHAKQYYNWGGTRKDWAALEARSAAVFVADNNPDPNVATVPMDARWSPLEHAADCAKELISPERYRTYGGYCNPTEYAAAGRLWQNLTY